MGRMQDSLGMPPEAFDGNGWSKRIPVGESNSTFVRPGKNSAGQRTSANRNASGFNLRGVCEVLTEFGLDPVAEIATIVKARKQKLVINADGLRVPQLDEDGNEVTEPALDIELRTKVLMELTNFVHPKLKAVEMTVKKPDLTEEQVEARLVELLARASKRALT